MIDTTSLKSLMGKDGIDKTTQNAILLFLRTLLNETFLNQVITDVGNIGPSLSVLSVFGIVSSMTSYFNAVQSGYNLLRALDQSYVHKYITFQMICIVSDNLNIDTNGLDDDFNDFYKFFDSHYKKTLDEFKNKTKVFCSC